MEGRKVEGNRPREKETSVGIEKHVLIPIEDILPNEWNVYRMTRPKFDRLVEEIQNEGFDGAIQVVAHPEKKGKYRIVDGEKRWAAARVAGLKEVPCVIKYWDEDKQRIETHTRNELRNDEFDRPKFTQLADDLMQRRQMTEQQLREAMAIQSDKRWNEMYLTKKPDKELAEELRTKEAESEMRVIDGLSVIVNRLIQEYGNTIPHGFMFFMLGKAMHLMVIVKNSDLKKKLDLIREQAVAEGRDINDLFLEHLR
ncbi:MAG: ParB N-terminal domain-containing protein [Deltaproteobacteria bacterium]|nr:ParB N-terminal domain-containing protein [Deltaproteobacteria bacterium]